MSSIQICVAIMCNASILGVFKLSLKRMSRSWLLSFLFIFLFLLDDLDFFLVRESVSKVLQVYYSMIPEFSISLFAEFVE